MYITLSYKIRMYTVSDSIVQKLNRWVCNVNRSHACNAKLNEMSLPI